MFQPSNVLSGSVLADYNRVMTRACIGLHDVLNSEVITRRSEPVEDFIRPDQAWKISLKRARKELPEQDIRGVALQKLRGILLADLGASRLGCSLKKMVEEGNNE